MSSSSTLIEIDSVAALEQHYGKKAVLLFGAEWHEATPILKLILGTLAANQQSDSCILFASVDAEEASDLADLLDVTMVPTLILLNGGDGKLPVVMEKMEGVVEPSQVTVAVQRLIQASEGEAVSDGADAAATAGMLTQSSTAASPDPKQAFNDRLKRLTHGDTVMLFMKGTPSAPRCGFSRQVVEMLNEQEVPFGSFDILSDEDVRQGLKTYSDWPTYPQIVSFCLLLRLLPKP